MSEESRGLFGRLKDKLSKSRSGFADHVKEAVHGHTKITDDLYDDLEAILIQADVGIDSTMTIVEDMKSVAKERRLSHPNDLLDVIKFELAKLLDPGYQPVAWTASDGPHVTLIAGVNGSGKTTTAGKLAAQLKGEGKSVMLGAADTFRAAAVEQLTIWSERADVPIIKHQDGSDPAAVAFDAADAAVSRNVDCLLLDTAGRLHTKVNLMEELKKIQRVIAKRIPSAPHEVLLVVDATTGQNGLTQARQFTDALDVTGIVLTKLDGTAKGGIAVAIQKELGIPIKMIGVGEGIDDLQPFNAMQFVNALFE